MFALVLSTLSDGSPGTSIFGKELLLLAQHNNDERRVNLLRQLLRIKQDV